MDSGKRVPNKTKFDFFPIKMNQFWRDEMGAPHFQTHPKVCFKTVKLLRFDPGSPTTKPLKIWESKGPDPPKATPPINSRPY